MNFKVVDGTYLPVSDEDYESIKDTYVNSNKKINDICKEYDLTQNGWKQIKTRIIEDTGYERPVAPPNHLYYMKSVGKWVVRKYYKGYERYYCGFHEKEKALKAIELLKEINWDYERRDEIKEKVEWIV